MNSAFGKILFYTFVNVISFSLFEWLADKSSFTVTYLYFLAIFIITFFVEKKSFNNDLLIQMPIGNFLFTFLGFYLPLPFIYNNGLLMFLSQWDTDYFALKALLYTNLGLHCTLIGYSFIKKVKFNYASGSRVFIKLNRILLLVGISLLSVIGLIVTGNYGITQQLSESANSYITILTSFYQFGFFGIIFLQYYHPQKKLINILVIALFFLLGLLSGMKEAAILPLITAGGTYYFRERKIPVKFGLIAILLITFTFIIVGKFRTTYLSSGRKELNSLSSLTSTYVKSVEESTKSKYRYYNISGFRSFINRLNYTTALGKSIKYSDKNGFGLPYNSDPVHILFSPFYSIIPRAILPFKPTADFGMFITEKVYKTKNAKYSTGISQTGYSYMWHGISGIIFLMFLVGVFQGFIYKVFYTTITPIYIYLFIMNIYVGDSIWTYFVSIFRFSFILLLIYFILGTWKKNIN